MSRRKYDNRPIGVFDSGIGGLTVAAALRRALPSEHIVYLGDTARVPYGVKSEDAIRHFAEQDVEFLFRRGVKMIVAACNTVSAVALKHVQQMYPDLPISGVIEAGVQAVVESGAESVTVIATKATVNSDAYRRALHAVNPGLIVETIACPLLVPFAEEGICDEPLTFHVLDLYLSGVRRNPMDALLLGCTHYPVFRKALEHYFGSSLKILDSAAACAVQLTRFLQEHSLSANPKQTGKSRFFMTDLPSDIQESACRFLGEQTRPRVEKVVLGD